MKLYSIATNVVYFDDLGGQGVLTLFDQRIPTAVAYDFHIAAEHMVTGRSKVIPEKVRSRVREKFPTAIDDECEMFVQGVDTVQDADGKQYHVRLERVSEQSNMGIGLYYVRSSVASICKGDVMGGDVTEDTHNFYMVAPKQASDKVIARLAKAKLRKKYPRLVIGKSNIGIEMVIGAWGTDDKLYQVCLDQIALEATDEQQVTSDEQQVTSSELVGALGG